MVTSARLGQQLNGDAETSPMPRTAPSVLPNGWNVTTLGALGYFLKGSSVKRDQALSGSLACVRYGEIYTTHHDYIRFFQSWISPEVAATARRLQFGDLLFAGSGETKEDIGKCVAFVLDMEAYAGGDIVILRPIGVDSLFLGYALNAPEIVRQKASLGQGDAVVHISSSALGQVSVRLPGIREQTAIAKTLADVDGLLAGLDSLIAKKRAIKLAVMQQLLTGKTRLPGFSEEWVTKRLGDVAHIKTGSRNNEDKSDDGQFPFFVRSETVERIDSYSYDCEAILVPGEGRIGSIFHYINGRFDVHQRVYAITQFTQEMSARFVHAHMTLHFGRWAMQNTVKATVDSLRLPSFQLFEMRVPPTKNEQTAIAIVLSDMDAEITALEARREKTAAIKRGMMQQLLTGRVRLLKAASAEAVP